MYVHYFTYVLLQGYQYRMTSKIVALYRHKHIDAHAVIMQGWIYRASRAGQLSIAVHGSLHEAGHLRRCALCGPKAPNYMN